MKDFMLLEDLATKEQIRVYKQKSLGKGSFGIVYPCRIRHRSQALAVKEIKKREGFDEKSIQNELEIHFGLQHKSILKVLKLKCYSDTHFYLFMQRAEKSLQQFVRDKYPKCMNQDQIIFLLRSILQALQYLRSSQISHNDIKPQNILLVKGIPKLSDFGIAKYFHASGKGGTPKFMCPQKFMKDYKQDIRGDVFSLGVTAYYCATRDLVYDDLQYEMLKTLNFEEVLRLFTQRFQKVSKKNISQLDSQLSQIILAMLHPSLQSRPYPSQLLELLPPSFLKRLQYDLDYQSTCRQENLIEKKVFLMKKEEESSQELKTLQEELKCVTSLLMVKGELQILLWRMAHLREVNVQVMKGVERRLTQCGIKWARQLQDNPVFKKFFSSLDLKEYNLYKKNFQHKTQFNKYKSISVQQFIQLVSQTFANRFISKECIEELMACNILLRLFRAKEISGLKRILSDYQSIKEDINEQLKYLFKKYPQNEWIIEI